MPFSVMTLSLLMRLLPKSTWKNSSGLKFQCHSINHWFQTKVPSSSRNALYDEGSLASLSIALTFGRGSFLAQSYPSPDLTSEAPILVAIRVWIMARRTSLSIGRPVGGRN